LEKGENMTEQEIDKTIAEHCGWSGIEDRLQNLMMAEGFSVFGHPAKGTVIGKKEPVPHYSRDFNALHEALQSLTEVELFRYADEVCDLTCDCNHDTDIQTMLMLSAKELSECYVRAIKKWKERQ
jgi:hypothetical protein